MGPTVEWNGVGAIGLRTRLHGQTATCIASRRILRDMEGQVPLISAGLDHAYHVLFIYVSMACELGNLPRNMVLTNSRRCRHMR
ncbi:hypothetical protein V6N13_122395 [Hibiscus sabdariffa]